MATGDTYTAEESAYQAEQGRRQNALLTSYAALHESLQQMAKDLQEHQKLAFQKQESAANREERAAAEKNRLAQDAIQNKISQGYLDIAKQNADRLAKEPSPQSERDTSMLFNQSLQRANRGEDPGDIAGFTPAQQTIIQTARKEGHANRTTQYQAGTADAEILNEKAFLEKANPILQGYIDAAPKGAFIGPGMGLAADPRIEGWKARIAENKARLTDLTKRANQIQETNKKTGHLYYHAPSDLWYSTVQPPPPLTAPKASEGSPADTGGEMKSGTRSLNYAPPAAPTTSTGTNAPGTVIIQNGNRFQIGPDGQPIHLGPVPAPLSLTPPPPPEPPPEPDLNMRAGGLLRGYGTGTSDSIPIHASSGEYIMPAAAVSQPGVLPLLEHIRRRSGGGLPARSLNYAEGGVVTAPLVPPSNWAPQPGANIMGGDGMPMGGAPGMPGMGAGGMDWKKILAMVMQSGILDRMGGGMGGGTARGGGAGLAQIMPLILGQNQPNNEARWAPLGIAPWGTGERSAPLGIAPWGGPPADLIPLSQAAGIDSGYARGGIVRRNRQLAY